MSNIHCAASLAVMLAFGISACNGGSGAEKATIADSNHVEIMHPAAPDNTVDTADRAFVSLITQATIAKISEQDAALSHSSNAQVKYAAGKIKPVHEQLNKDLTAYAQRHNLALPAIADESRRQILNDMLAKKGKAFDEDYTAHQVSGHTKLVAKFGESAGKMKDAALNSLIDQYLPQLKELLKVSNELSLSLAK